MNRKTIIIASSALAALVGVAGLVWLVSFAHASPLALVQANAPRLITYQGYLTDASGDPVTDGNYDLKFELCTASGCSTVLWTETHLNQPVQDGYFTVNLGSNTPFDASDFDGSERWLRVSAKASSESIYDVFPAQQIAAVPYAFSLLPGAAISGTANAYGSIVTISGTTGIAGSILTVRDNGSEIAISGSSWGGSGVYGGSDTVGSGVFGWSERGAGVEGQTTYGYGGRFSSAVGHALLVEGPSLDQGRNPKQIGLLRWYEAVSMTAPITFSVGNDPEGLAFDGDHIWVASFMDDTVTKLRASDGAVIGTYNVGNAPRGVCFDGKYIWTANSGSDSVTKLRASDGVSVGTYSVDSNPVGIAFDGANIWVTSLFSSTVTKLRASDGSLVGKYGVGAEPTGVAFDGANIWVTNAGSDNVTKLRASDGTALITTSVGSVPAGIAFDGANIWVANYSNGSNGSVTRIRASDGVVLNTFTGFDGPFGVLFDGGYIWVADRGGSLVKLRADDGSVVATVRTPIGDFGGMAFDGSHVWVENSGGAVSKH